MPNHFYKIRKNRLVAGVVAGLADKFGWDLALARILAIILMVSTQFGIFLYLVLAFLLPYKEDIYPEMKRSMIDLSVSHRSFFFALRTALKTFL